MRKTLLLLCYLGWSGYAQAQKAPVVNLLKDIPANQDYPPTNFIEFNDEVYFLAYSTEAGKELWKTDGTETGTIMVKDIFAGSSNSDIAELTVFNNKLYFLASNSTNGREIWQTDGTQEGTTVLKDINPGTFIRNVLIGGLTVVDSIMYFHADDGTHGDELWKTDGTEVGTVMVKDVNDGPIGSCPALFTNNGGIVYFIANPTNSEYGNSLGGRELWKTDGTEVGTIQVKDFGVGNGGIQHITVLNGEVYFGASDGTNGRELWKTDGTLNGTLMVKDIYLGSGNSDPSFATVFNKELYFFARSNYSSYYYLYKTDGTESGTVQISNYLYYGSGIKDYIHYQGSLYIGGNGQLWKITEGSTTATQIANASGNPTNFFIFNDELYFRANYGVWKSDGTGTGTVNLKNFNYVNVNSSGFIVFDSVLHFQAADYTFGTEVWRTDGTVAGTERVTDLWPGSPGNTMPIIAYKDALLLAGSNGTSQCDLWQLHYNNAPTSDSITITVSEDKVYTFDKDNFSFVDEDKSDSLSAVFIATVFGKGFLFYDKNNNQRLDHADIMVEDSTEFSVEELEQLAFVGDENEFGQAYASFTFKVKDPHQYSDSIYSATIHVNPVADLPTITYANTTYGQVNAEGLTVTRNEVDGEEVNSVEIMEINNGRLFRHDQEKEFHEGDIISYETANTGLKFLADSAGIGSVSIRAVVSRTGDGLSNEAINYVWVDKADQQITINEIPDQVYSNDTIVVSAAATSGLEVSLIVNGPARVEDSLLIIEDTGIISLVASQAGNRNYYPAAPLVQNIASVGSHTVQVTISLEVPSSVQVGDAIELKAECSVPWPVSYSVEGPALLAASKLTAVDTGKVVVTATLLSEDASQSLVIVREEIEVKADIVAAIGDSLDEFDAIRVFPNPVQNRVQIRTDALAWREATVVVKNAVGQKVSQMQLTSTQTEIDMTSYAPGLYLLIIENKADRQILRVTKN